MPELSITISANTVAWYAAIVATVSASVTILNYLSDRRKLKVSASHGLITGTGDWSAKVILTAANTGKRPVTIQGVGFTFYDKSDLILTTTPNLNLPKTVKEGDSCSTWIDHAELITSLRIEKREIGDIKCTWFRDSTGKRYTQKFKLKW